MTNNITFSAYNGVKEGG